MDQTRPDPRPVLGPAQRRNVIRVTYVIAALDVTWMFLQFSVTPYMAKKLGFDTLWFGYLQTLVGVLQLIGNPLFGRFGDLFGARMALSVSCGATVVFFLLLASAEHPAMLFIHKLPTLFMHVLPACQMVVADLSDLDKRAESLSKIGLCFGIGMLAGSTLGGHLNTLYGEKMTACVGAAGSFLSLMLVLKFIPKNTKPPNTNTSNEAANESIFSLGKIIQLLSYPGVAPIFMVKIVADLPTGIFQVMFSIIALDVFQLEPQQNGYLMAFFGIVQMVIQGAVIGRLTARFSEKSLLLMSIGVAAFVGLAQAYMQSVMHFCIIVVPMMLSLSVFAVITESILTKSVPRTETGTMMGLCAAEQSLVRTVGPTIGGYLYVNGGVKAIGLMQCVVNAVIFAALLRRPLRAHEHME